MRIYTTRREAEIILHCLYMGATYATPNEITDYYNLINRMHEILAEQCKYDHTTYRTPERNSAIHTDC